MAEGADVVFQATFFDGRWRGHADFLIRADRPSRLGAWSYDVADTKLARRVKAGAIIQMCVYADLLGQLQGAPPETLTVVTGDGGLARPSVRRLRRLLSAGESPLRGARLRRRPSPRRPTRTRSTIAGSAAGGRTAWTRREADDHLSLVAGMTRTATERLVGRRDPHAGPARRDGPLGPRSPT